MTEKKPEEVKCGACGNPQEEIPRNFHRGEAHSGENLEFTWVCRDCGTKNEGFLLPGEIYK